MRAATATSTLPDGDDAIREAWEKIESKIDDPALIIVACTVAYDTAQLHGALRQRAPEAKIQGAPRASA